MSFIQNTILAFQIRYNVGKLASSKDNREERLSRLEALVSQFHPGMLGGILDDIAGLSKICDIEEIKKPSGQAGFGSPPSTAEKVKFYVGLRLHSENWNSEEILRLGKEHEVFYLLNELSPNKLQEILHNSRVGLGNLPKVLRDKPGIIKKLPERTLIVLLKEVTDKDQSEDTAKKLANAVAQRFPHKSGDQLKTWSANGRFSPVFSAALTNIATEREARV